MPDFRDLISRMADELDYYRISKEGDDEGHPFAREARAALAEPEPEEPTQRQLLQLAAEFWPEGCEPAQAVPFARAVLSRWGRPACCCGSG